MEICDGVCWKAGCRHVRCGRLEGSMVQSGVLQGGVQTFAMRCVARVYVDIWNAVSGKVVVFSWGRNNMLQFTKYIAMESVVILDFTALEHTRSGFSTCEVR